jgi:hypothetical protein
MVKGMELIKIYESLCDRTRLRILNLLLEGPNVVNSCKARLAGKSSMRPALHAASRRSSIR